MPVMHLERAAKGVRLQRSPLGWVCVCKEVQGLRPETCQHLEKGRRKRISKGGGELEEKQEGVVSWKRSLLMAIITVWRMYFEVFGFYSYIYTHTHICVS